MDKKYLKEQNLYEAHKQFMRLCERTYFPESLEEDEAEDMPQDPQQDPNAAPQDPNMGGEMPPMDGQDPNMGGEQAPMDGQQPMDGMDGQDPNMAPPMDDMGMGDPNMAQPMEPQEDETVIDVEDLTDAQEDMNKKVNTVGRDLGKMEDKITQLMTSIDDMMRRIDSNNAEIQAFKQEFEKRNPTQTEKLNLRSLDSYPFNVNVKDFWDKKNGTSNYDVYTNNEERPDDKRSLEITNSDVDDFDERTIADSFKIDDDLQQTIEKIFA